ncbi:MAG: hypothetical protein LBT43_12465 [Prevotella sp.]|nr:hypothetical protein [Prevotella sp.]
MDVNEVYDHMSYAKDINKEWYKKYKQFSKNLVYGMDIYSKLLSYIDYLSKGEIAFDYRVFRVLWEHKNFMGT